ncbi:zinc finger CCCH-type antiviral protein 1-like [Dendropsophus ebraccatus]|uniref:zinc finger CCCH-type antiviral protein 1-like n=1 Tax=Dendropsophus ebraccatus TaxID=150705 RepID=UPI0038318882
MSDPTVSRFLTQVLCSQGGQLHRDLLADFLELPIEQIEEILQDEPQKFPVVGELVLARSPVRICAKYLKYEEEEECDKLHLCRHYLRGKCRQGRRTRCTFSHDISSDHNRTVLKANEISGLSEEEIKVLLFQNDDNLLPEVCRQYVCNECDHGEDCSRLHVCSYFIRGECNRRTCNRSHHLLEFGSDLLLTRCHMSEKTVQNFQMLCNVKHNERLQTLREEGRKDQQKRQPGAQRGRGGGRGRPRNRKQGDPQGGARGKSQGGQQQQREGFQSRGRSGSRPASESGDSQLCCSGEDDENNDEAFEARILSDWFNSPLGESNNRRASRFSSGMSSGRNHPTPTVYTSKVGNSRADVQSTLPVTPPKESAQPGFPAGLSSSSSTPSAPQTKPTTEGPVNPPPSSAVRPSKPVTLPVRSPSAADSVIPVPPKVVNPSTAPVLPTGPSRLVDPPINSPSVTQRKPVPPTMVNPSTAPVLPTGPSRLVDPPINSPSVTQRKPVPPTVVNPSTAPVLLTTPSRLVESHINSPSVPQDKLVTPISSPYRPQPVVTTTIKPVFPPSASPPSAPSTSDTRLVNSHTKGLQWLKPVQPQPPLASSSGKPQANVKPVTKAEPKDLYKVSILHEDLLDDVTTNSSHLSYQWERSSANGATYLPPKRQDSDQVLEICLSNLWKFCKLGACCPHMHYNLPYRWQIYNGTNWEDISKMEKVEKGFCDPNIDRAESVDFVTMRSGVHRVRRLSTVSSVMKPPEYVLTTEWLWYCRDEYRSWTEYGHNNVKEMSSTISSSDLENVYLSDRTAIIPFTIDDQRYEINSREMKQRNIVYKTEKDVRRRPRYLSCEDVKLLRGSTKSSAPQSLLKSAASPWTSATSPRTSAASPRTSAASPLTSAAAPRTSAADPLTPLKADIYPRSWDRSALPEKGCKKVLIPETSSEFSEIVSSFTKTVSGHVVKKLWRLQNPTLWKVFHSQKEEMVKVSQGQDVKEMRLFHGAVQTHVHIIHNEGFDWNICGFHGFGYGQGNYFARDALYADNYSVPAPDGTQSMFIARVLVGDYATGSPQMTSPPLRPNSITRRYDSCVDNIINPAIFVVFKRHQIYPEYLLEYEKQKKSCVIC